MFLLISLGPSARSVEKSTDAREGIKINEESLSIKIAKLLLPSRQRKSFPRGPKRKDKEAIVLLNKFFSWSVLRQYHRLWKEHFWSHQGLINLRLMFHLKTHPS